MQDWIDNGPYTAEKAKAAGMIDAVEQREASRRCSNTNTATIVIFDKKYGEKKPPELDLPIRFR